MMHQKKWLCLVPFVLNPVKRQISYGICDVFAFELDRIFAPRIWSTNSKFGVVIFALPWQDAVMVEVGRFIFEMPLPNYGRLVASFSHLNRKHLFAGRDSPAEIENTIYVVVLTGDHAGP